MCLVYLVCIKVSGRRFSFYRKKKEKEKVCFGDLKLHYAAAIVISLKLIFYISANKNMFTRIVSVNLFIKYANPNIRIRS